MAGALIANVLASRYASARMTRLWSAEGRVRLERELWIAVMKSQQRLGVAIPDGAIAAYERVKDQIDLASIAAREKVTRHDVKARIDEFCELAGFELVHRGMTSRDLTENVEQLQILSSLRLVQEKSAALALRLAERIEADVEIPLTARTHNVPAQLTTLGRRWATYAEEFLIAFRDLGHLIASYPARGLKGAVGTQLDQWVLLGQDGSRVSELEDDLLRHLGFSDRLVAVGQVYPRSLDFRVVAQLCQLASGPSNFARAIRLMAGHGTVSEGFAPEQTGSSAMPHKVNSRSCERLNGFHAILKGHVTMAAALAGDQWNEGDVSCSVVRRVVLPDAFFAIDALLDTLLVVLTQMEVYATALEAENDRHLPFLLSTTILLEAVRQGVGRETAHELIKQHALAALEGQRAGSAEPGFIERIAADPRLRLSRQEIERLVESGRRRTGRASEQAREIAAELRQAAAAHPEAVGYAPDPIL
jgi:adenylosuccinate lyase